MSSSAGMVPSGGTSAPRWGKCGIGHIVIELNADTVRELRSRRV